MVPRGLGIAFLEWGHVPEGWSLAPSCEPSEIRVAVELGDARNGLVPASKVGEEVPRPVVGRDRQPRPQRISSPRLVAENEESLLASGALPKASPQAPGVRCDPSGSSAAWSECFGWPSGRVSPLGIGEAHAARLRSSCIPWVQEFNHVAWDDKRSWQMSVLGSSPKQAPSP